jgi:hypothetical protein
MSIGGCTGLGWRQTTVDLRQVNPLPPDPSVSQGGLDRRRLQAVGDFDRVEAYGSDDTVPWRWGIALRFRLTVVSPPLPSDAGG